MTARVRVMLALACAALAALASQAYAQDARRQEARLRQETLERYGGEVVSLVVATHQLEVGQAIAESDVELKDWVVELAPEGALVSLEEVVGSVPNAAVAKGQVITDLVLSSPTSSLEIPSGMVAVELALSDRLALVSGVDPGSRVFAYRVASEGAQLVSSGVTVVSVTGEGGALTTTKYVTVAARPADIPALLEAAAEGTLRLVVPANNVNAAAVGVESAPTVVEALPDADDSSENERTDDSSEHEGEAESQPLEGDEDGDR